MTIKNRLHQLRRQSGQDSSTPRAASIAERMGKMRVRKPPSPMEVVKISDELLAVRVGGWVEAPGLIVIEQRLSRQEQHGGFVLQQLFANDGVLPEVEGVAPESLVFMDTETTGLAGGSGTLVFLLGLARLEADALVVRQYLLTAFSGEQPMLTSASAWLADARAMVTYNGKSFDAPLLTTRARLAGVADAFGELEHIDLLHTTRRAFGSRWEDCRLATVEKELLKFTRLDDLPGAEAPEAWHEWVHLGRFDRLPGVAEHNYWDLVSLAALLPLLGEVHRNPRMWNADVLAFARAHIKSKRYEHARLLLEQCREGLCDKGLLELAWLYRRDNDWEQARTIWEPLAEAGSSEAREWLAKYYEHVAKDLKQALDHAYALPEQDCHDQRRKRLEDRLAKAG